MMMRTAALLALTLLATGCASQPSAPSVCTKLGATPSLQVTLMFGLCRPNGGGPVTATDWANFVAKTVTPRFPDGLTVFEASGQWRDRVTNTVGSEPSRLIQIVTPDSPDLPARIAAIRTAYDRQFDQQSVGVQISRGCAAF